MKNNKYNIKGGHEDWAEQNLVITVKSSLPTLTVFATQGRKQMSEVSVHCTAMCLQLPWGSWENADFDSESLAQTWDAAFPTSSKCCCCCWFLATAGLAETEQVSGQTLNGQAGAAALSSRWEMPKWECHSWVQVNYGYNSDHSWGSEQGFQGRSIASSCLPFWVLE